MHLDLSWAQVQLGPVVSGFGLGIEIKSVQVRARSGMDQPVYISHGNDRSLKRIRFGIMVQLIMSSES